MERYIVIEIMEITAKYILPLILSLLILGADVIYSRKGTEEDEDYNERVRDQRKNREGLIILIAYAAVVIGGYFLFSARINLLSKIVRFFYLGTLVNIFSRMRYTLETLLLFFYALRIKNAGGLLYLIGRIGISYSVYSFGAGFFLITRILQLTGQILIFRKNILMILSIVCNNIYFVMAVLGGFYRYEIFYRISTSYTLKGINRFFIILSMAALIIEIKKIEKSKNKLKEF